MAALKGPRTKKAKAKAKARARTPAKAKVPAKATAKTPAKAAPPAKAKTTSRASDVLSLAALGRATLARQMLLAREAKVTPLEAVERLFAIQAQWPKPPFMALHARLAGFEREQLTRLARDYKIVRGTAWRGTIFVLTA